MKTSKRSNREEFAPASRVAAGGAARPMRRYSARLEATLREGETAIPETVRAELRSAFNAAAGSPNGLVPVTELEELVKRKGYTLIPYAIREALQEAADLLGEDISGGVTLAVFERLCELLEQHEGFCRSDLDILEGSFQGFDITRDGAIDSRLLRPLLVSLDFCLDETIVESLFAQELACGRMKLSWKDFLSISRKRVQMEFDLAQRVFKRCDDDEDGLLRPGELMRLFSQLGGVSFLPETFADVAEECGVNPGAVDFNSFWTMLQVLRSREGFTLDESAELRAVFAKFDSTSRGEMPLKRVPGCMKWLGHEAGPGVLGKGHKQVEIPSTGGGYMTEAQFMRLARKHREAQMKAIRKVYRSFAEDGGAGKLDTDNMQAAVMKLNRLFVNDFLDWIKMFRPSARAKNRSSFDFEEFRLIVLHCCDRLQGRIHKNVGYTDTQLQKLRIEFVKYMKEGEDAEVDPAGLMKLFKSLFPQAQTSHKVRVRLRKALEDNSAKNAGLDWHTFLRVMRAYDDYTDVDAEQTVQDGLEELGIPDACADEAQDLIARLYHGEKGKGHKQLSPHDVMFLCQVVAPELTEEEAAEALERLWSAERESECVEGEFRAVHNLKIFVYSGDEPVSPKAKSHDVL